MSNQSSQTIPSIEYCITGCLMQNEKYNQFIHNYRTTIRERAPQLLHWYSVNEVENWVNNNPLIKVRLTTEKMAEIYSILYPLHLATEMQ